MEILRRWKCPETETFLGTCRKCGSHLRAAALDVTVDKYGRYLGPCPVCCGVGERNRRIVEFYKEN